MEMYSLLLINPNFIKIGGISSTLASAIDHAKIFLNSGDKVVIQPWELDRYDFIEGYLWDDNSFNEIDINDEINVRRLVDNLLYEMEQYPNASICLKSTK
jgi:hypothetical protein